MIKVVGAVLYFVWFVLLIFAAAYYLWDRAPELFYFNVAAYAIAALSNIFKVKTPLSWWCNQIIIGIDQYWQVALAPLLNIAVSTKHKFGHADQHGSSVVGKNLRDTNGLQWKLIEKFLSIVLEFGKPHSIPSIEEDEGA